jgi:hypothetical protein
MSATVIQSGFCCCAVAALLCGSAASGNEAALAESGLRIVEDAASGRLTITDGSKPVLTYNFNTVPVPAGVTGIYAVARSNYVHPLYGPEGEVLTKDYSPDHPHHRGIYWAWPELTWKGDKRDLHALQGVFARPLRIVRKDVSNGSALIEAENVWKWGDTEAVVRELAKIVVSQDKDQRRTIDFEFQFQALVEGLTLARREMANYGGFNMRLSARDKQTILTHIADPATNPRAAWACLAGIPPDGKQPVSVAILQPATNPEYPGDWVQYPDLNWLQPTFPSQGTRYELTPGKTLVLRYRLVVFYGEADAALLQRLWTDYAGVTAPTPATSEAK